MNITGKVENPYVDAQVAGRSVVQQVKPAEIAPPVVQATQPSPVSQKALEEAVTKANEAMRLNNLNFKISQDKDSGTTVVQIVDSETDTIVRQIPSPEMLDLSKSLRKMQGLLFKLEA